MKKTLQLLCLLPALLLTACVGSSSSSGSGNNPPPPPTPPAHNLTSITIITPNYNLFVGESEQLTATGYYSDNTTEDLTQKVTWLSSDNNIITLTNPPFIAGIATAKALGSSNIVATYQEINSNQITLNVIPPASLESIVISAPESTVYLNESMQLSAMGTYSDGTHKDLTNIVNWVSSSESVVTITSGGVLQANNDINRVGISANYQGVDSNTESIIIKPEGTIININIDNAEQICEPTQAHAIATDSNGNNYDISYIASWTSSNPSAITVSLTGLMIPHDLGSAVISASYDGVTNSGVYDVDVMPTCN